MNISPASNLGTHSRSRRFNKQFKSPVLVREEVNSPATRAPNSTNGESDQLTALTAIKQNCAMLNEDIKALREEGIDESELAEHIAKLHEYNEIKDATQVVLGHLANLEGLTVAELHTKFNLDLKE